MNKNALDDKQKVALKAIKKVRRRKFFRSKAFFFGVAMNLVTWYLIFFCSESEKQEYFPYILFALFIFLVYNMRKHRNDNDIITLQKQELEEKKKTLEEKNKEITDSIRYARRIQQSLLPSEKYIAKNLRRLQNK